MSHSVYRLEIERQYGAAGKFVQRSVDAYRNMVSFYNPTPNQCIHRLLSHLERVSALGDKMVTDKQREKARDAIFAMIERAQQDDAQYDGRESQEEVPWGDAESVLKQEGTQASGIASRRAFHDYQSDPVCNRLPTELLNERVSFGDPAVVLARYVIRANQNLLTFLTPAQDEQFELNHQHQIMERLRRIEKRLMAQRRVRTPSELPRCEGGLCRVGGE